MRVMLVDCVILCLSLTADKLQHEVDRYLNTRALVDDYYITLRAEPLPGM